MSDIRSIPNLHYFDPPQLCKVGEEAGGGGYPVKEMDEMELEAGLPKTTFSWDIFLVIPYIRVGR